MAGRSRGMPPRGLQIQEKTVRSPGSQIGIYALLEALLRFAVRKHAGVSVRPLACSTSTRMASVISPVSFNRTRTSDATAVAVYAPFFAVGAEITNLRQAPLAAIFDLILA